MRRILLALSLFLVPVVALALDYSNRSDQYTDAPFSKSEAAAISVLTNLKAVQGNPDGTFMPGRTLNRAEFLKIVLMSMPDVSVQASDASDCFPDVHQADWFSSFVCYAKTKGMISGYPDGTFRPAQVVNYAEALKILSEGYGLSIEKDSTGAWYEPYVAAVKNAQLLLSSSTTYDQSLTRGQMAILAASFRANAEGELAQYRAAEQGGSAVSTSSESSIGISSSVPYLDGKLIMKGSDTALQMFTNIAEAFAKLHPDAYVSVSGGGAGPGISAWINHYVDVATSSRELTNNEIAQAKARGLDPQRLVPATDGLTVIVNPENPVRQMTVAQVSQIYQGKITNWKDVGGKDLAINIYGRHSTTGTAVYFRDFVVKADYSTRMKEFEGDQDIIDTLKKDPGAIGYVGVGWVVDKNGAPRTDIATVDLPSTTDPTKYVSSQDEQAVLSGSYPIARPLQLFFSGIPAKNSLLGQFLSFSVSPAALEGIRKAGFYPPSTAEAAKNAAFLQLMK